MPASTPQQQQARGACPSGSLTGASAGSASMTYQGA